MGKPKPNGGLDFWNLERFNLALLAKQFWRTMTCRQSLVAIILKEKYFKHDNIMDVEIKGNVSLIWRSIVAVKEIILLGARWRLGNGTIWKDKWLPSPTSYQIQSPNSILDENVLV